MSDIASLAPLDDPSWERGTIDACNAILAYMNNHGMAVAATAVLIAWNAGEIGGTGEPARVKPAAPPPAILLDPPQRISREQARGSGYTGDQCSFCQSMQVKRNGSCLVCEACGNTTGCS